MAGTYHVGFRYFAAGPMGISRGVVIVTRGDDVEIHLIGRVGNYPLRSSPLPEGEQPMADDCKDLVRLSINGYIDEPTRYMVEWHAIPLQAGVKLGSYECIVQSTDGAIDWYMNGTVTGGASAEVEGEFTSPHFRQGMVLDVSLGISILGTGTSCHLQRQIIVGQES